MIYSTIQDLINQKEIIQEAKELVKDVYLRDDIPWVIGYSGGKDSTTTTHLIIESLIELKNLGIELNKHVYVISSDTLVETPMIIKTISDTISGINELSKSKDIPVSAHIVSPKFDQTFWANIIGRGYPTPNQTFRWCTDRMKIDPANRFVLDVVGRHGRAIMVLGVRDGESISRDRVIDNYKVEGMKLMRHSTLPNAFVFAPIRKFTTDLLWTYLLESESPWGADYRELYKLYSESSSECPLIIDENVKKEAGSCGNSRFGCWVCTVVKEDKSLSGFIKSGEEWLRPLLEFRNWLYSIRDNDSLRMKRRTNGMLYFTNIKYIDDQTLMIPEKGAKSKNVIKKVDNQWIDERGSEWTLYDSIDAEEQAKNHFKKHNIDLSEGENPRILIKNIKGDYQQLGNGPFTFQTRRMILEKLLKLQKSLDKEHELIKKEELHEIRKIWLDSGDYEDHLPKIYEEIYNEKFDILSDDFGVFSNTDLSFLNKICDEHGFEFKTYYELLHNTRSNVGFLNRHDAQKKMSNILSKEHLLYEMSEDHES